jgi:hypothetical protein
MKSAVIIQTIMSSIFIVFLNSFEIDVWSTIDTTSKSLERIKFVPYPHKKLPTIWSEGMGVWVKAQNGTAGAIVEFLERNNLSAGICQF